MKITAIIGPTASGKSALAHTIAKQTNATILSLDSLALYKEIDILSAKPTKEELCEVHYEGINLITPDAYYSTVKYLELYNRICEQCELNNQDLILVGGSSFYLKTLIDGISNTPQIDESTIKKVNNLLCNLPKAYQCLKEYDLEYANTLKENDAYRIEKALQLAIQTNMAPTAYWKKYPKLTAEHNKFPIYNIEQPREYLRSRIQKRTEIMCKQGAVD